MRTKVTLTATFCLLAMFTGLSPASGEQGIEPYTWLVGSWTGELEYLDYGDNQTRVQLPTTLDCTVDDDGNALELRFTYTEPNGKVMESTERLVVSGKGVYFGDLWQLKEAPHQVASETQRLVLERQDKDSGRRATLRNTVSLQGQDLTITLTVTYDGGSESLQRNQYRLRSVGAEPDAAGLVGTWSVDLRPTPDADPYFQEFVVSEVDGNTFQGTFYGTALENGRINRDWGDLRFAFTTDDGSGAYHTSGTLVGDELTGTTHALGREFLSVWTATRAK